MKTSSKIVLLLGAFFLLAAACNQTQPQANNQPAALQQTSPSTIANPPATPQTQTLSVTQIVQGSNLNKPSDAFVTGEMAIQLLKSDHKVETKSYSGIGEMVLSIDGVKPDSKHYWEFFVNGKSSNVGASSYILKAGDKIEWKLSLISSSGE
jgi:hypothetical protein